MIVYKCTTDIAGWFGVEVRTVSKWRDRYTDFPEPDAMTGSHAGWLPERETEIKTWYKNRVGQGARTDLQRPEPGMTTAAPAAPDASGDDPVPQGHRLGGAAGAASGHRGRPVRGQVH